MNQKRAARAKVLRWFALAATIAVIAGSASISYTQAPATGRIQLSVISARSEPRAFGGTGVVKGVAVTEFKYIINEDNTGDPRGATSPFIGTPADTPACDPAKNPDYPDGCKWPSIHSIEGSSPIFTQGQQNDFNSGLSSFTLPPGKYLISVLAAGYKLDGKHFSIPAGGTVNVTVELQPHPLPTATLHTFVFEDNASTNGQYDAPAEHGLAGFQGHIADYLGEVTTDVFGNPLCTEYLRDGLGNVILNAPDYTPTVTQIGGRCLSDANGDLVIPNLGPNRYALSVTPPDGSSWVQTTTLEGNLDWDTWLMEGATGLDTEFVVAGEPFPASIFGYVQPKAMPASSATGRIKRVIDTVKVYVPAKESLSLPNTI